MGRGLTVVCLLLGLTGPAAAQPDFPELEPAAIREAYAQDAARWMPAPEILLAAFIAAEDRDFRTEPASRSTLPFLIAGWYPEPDFPNRRVLGLAVAQALSRAEILDWIVHRIFFGQGCFGIDGAALAYFGTPAERLALHEAAYLAALPRAPALFHPLDAPDRARERRDFVLREMVTTGAISPAEAEAATAKPLDVRTPLGRCQ